MLSEKNINQLQFTKFNDTKGNKVQNGWPYDILF